MDFPRSFSVVSDEIAQDLPTVVRFVREFRLGGFELRSLFGRAFKDLTERDLARVRAVIRDEGWRIHGCASPVFKCPIDDRTAIREQLDVFKRSLEAAEVLGCDLARVFTFLRRRQPLHRPATTQIAEHISRLSEIAAGCGGVRIGVENEASCMVATADELVRLFRLLPQANLGIVWDPCNALYVLPPRQKATRGYSALVPRIFHIHLKDAVRSRHPAAGSPAVSVPFGLGDVGWRAHLAEIRQSGYRGLLSLETHWRAFRLDDRLLHLPAGHAFSRGGAEATRICLRNLEALWRAAHDPLI